MSSNSAREPVLDEQTMQLGLLMEAAQAQQKTAEASLRKLRAVSQELAGSIRAEVQQQLAAAFESLASDSRRASDALREVRRAAGLRLIAWSVGLTVLCSLIPLGIISWLLPSPHEIAALRSQYAMLSNNIAALERNGARMELRHCGDKQRLCVRIDRSAPSYGEKADFLIAMGY